MRCLALDVGDRRIGVASGEHLASPLLTFTRGSRDDDLQVVAGLIREHQAQCLVVGLPLNMDGSVGFQAQRVKRYVEHMGSGLAALGIAIDLVLWDERLTTGEAERVMAIARQRRYRRRDQVDAVAAAVILQSYLDERARQNRPETEGIGL